MNNLSNASRWPPPEIRQAVIIHRLQTGQPLVSRIKLAQPRDLARRTHSFAVARNTFSEPPSRYSTTACSAVKPVSMKARRFSRICSRPRQDSRSLCRTFCHQFPSRTRAATSAAPSSSWFGLSLLSLRVLDSSLRHLLLLTSGVSRLRHPIWAQQDTAAITPEVINVWRDGRRRATRNHLRSWGLMPRNALSPISPESAIRKSSKLEGET